MLPASSEPPPTAARQRSASYGNALEDAAPPASRLSTDTGAGHVLASRASTNSFNDQQGALPTPVAAPPAPGPPPPPPLPAAENGGLAEALRSATLRRTKVGFHDGFYSTTL